MESATVQLHAAHTMATALVAPSTDRSQKHTTAKDMSRTCKTTHIKPVDSRRESVSLEHLEIKALEQTTEDPWDLTMLVEKLNSSNWFCEVAEA